MVAKQNQQPEVAVYAWGASLCSFLKYRYYNREVVSQLQSLREKGMKGGRERRNILTSNPTKISFLKLFTSNKATKLRIFPY